MNAVRLSLKASDLPESLKAIRDQIERDVPLGAGGAHDHTTDIGLISAEIQRTVVDPLFGGNLDKFLVKASTQMGVDHAAQRITRHRQHDRQALHREGQAEHGDVLHHPARRRPRLPAREHR
jgi:RNA-splicing ligase RtcB